MNLRRSIILSVIFVSVTVISLNLNAKTKEKNTEEELTTHHPINIEIKQKIDLPLLNDKFLTCSTCHSQHVTKKEPSKKGAGSTHYLQKEYSQLCLTCHADKTVKEFNHIKQKLSKVKETAGENEVVSCNRCHSMHFGAKKLITLQEAKLCLSCHSPQKRQPHKVQIIVAKTQRAKGIHLDGDKLTCQTCHSTHGRSLEKHFLAEDDHPILVFCASCHGPKAPELYKAFHKRLNAKKSNESKDSKTENSSTKGE